MAGAQDLLDAIHDLWRRGFCPATSGNFSARIDDERIWITASGRDKGKIRASDLLAYDLGTQEIRGTAGAARTGKPSAETLLHTVLYEERPEIGAVLHVHSLPATVLTKALTEQSTLVLTDYELLKALDGITTHEQRVGLPIFENTQDIAELAEITRGLLRDGLLDHGYLLRGHGMYVWGHTLEDALRHLEALDFVLRCELEMLAVPWRPRR
jgi:methylthioribulose-1-phosphate dehydratase